MVTSLLDRDFGAGHTARLPCPHPQQGAVFYQGDGIRLDVLDHSPAKEKVAKPVREQSAAPAKPRRARKPGYLIVVAPNQSKIFVDGKDTGRKTPVAPSNPLTLGPGRHKVRLEAGDQSTDHRVVIKSGKTAKLIVR